MSLIPRSTRFLAALVVFALASGVGGALAARGDPQKQLTPADNARARSMLLKKADLGPGFTGKRAGTAEVDFYCKALDESDLTLTGEAKSPNFERGVVFVSSAVQVYQSVAEASTSWRRATSADGERCSQDVLRREFAKQLIQLESIRRISFPKVADRTIAYRIELSAQSQGITFPLVLDWVVVMRSRAHVALFFTGLTAVPRSEQVPLARLTAKRMATAMRGS